MVRPVEPTPVVDEGATGVAFRMGCHRLAAADFYYTVSPEMVELTLELDHKVAQRIRRTKAYKEKLEELAKEMEQGLDSVMREEAMKLKRAWAAMVPKAIEVIRDHLIARDPMLQASAAREVLDRDGRLPKVSKVQSQVQVEEKIPAVSDRLIAEFSSSTTVN